MIMKLDNPVWYSLLEVHKNLCVDYGTVKFYQPDYCPFGAFENVIDTSAALDEYAQLSGNFFVVGKKPSFSKKLVVKNELICLQMVIENMIELEDDNDIIKINNNYKDALFMLVNEVQPGYFKKNTFMVGDYYGILKEDKLIAVTGERMKMDGFTEVSAVVTHPDYTGKGYAKKLVAYTVNKMFTQNKLPYLHVAEKNIAAINLYEKLGFKTRRKISFWNIIKRKEI